MQAVRSFVPTTGQRMNTYRIIDTGQNDKPVRDHADLTAAIDWCSCLNNVHGAQRFKVHAYVGETPEPIHIQSVPA